MPAYFAARLSGYQLQFMTGSPAGFPVLVRSCRHCLRRSCRRLFPWIRSPDQFRHCLGRSAPAAPGSLARRRQMITGRTLKFVFFTSMPGIKKTIINQPAPCAYKRSVVWISRVFLKPCAYQVAQLFIVLWRRFRYQVEQLQQVIAKIFIRGSVHALHLPSLIGFGRLGKYGKIFNSLYTFMLYLLS